MRKEMFHRVTKLPGATPQHRNELIFTDTDLIIIWVCPLQYYSADLPKKLEANTRSKF